MHCLDLTLPTPAENLALDEALLDAAEADGQGEVLRFWQPAEPMVVVGRSSRLGDEVHVARCRQRGVPILRRPSGGAAIVTGPGCLMYAVVLQRARHAGLATLDHAHRFVLSTIAAGLAGLGIEACRCGTSDLTWQGRKFSGNSLRCKRTHLLYHGTLLYGFPLELIAELLPMPPRTPDYRAGRAHDAFVGNLPVAADSLRHALVAAWKADTALPDWPRALTARLAAERYGQQAWTEQC
jgi:lipoate-protein ligase A